VTRTLSELAGLLGAVVVGDGSIEIHGVTGIQEAGPGDLTFLANPKYEKYLAETSASAVIVSPDYRARCEELGKPALVVENPYSAFASAVTTYLEPSLGLPRGVHPTAVVDEAAEIGREAAVGAHVVVAAGARLGDRVVVHPGAYIGTDVTVGADSIVYPNATIRRGSAIGERVIIHSGSVIGSDGFGFARETEGHRKIPQVGNVVIEDDVEVGANACIDRATVGTTRIGRGTKIDNLVQIGHNVRIGEGSIVVAQVGISGSTRLGRNVVLGGQVGVAGHIEIGDGVMVGAQSGVTRSVPNGEVVSGYPARRHSLSKRLYACLQRLPSLFERTRDLERRIGKLEEDE